jgi:hypothetical protein
MGKNIKKGAVLLREGLVLEKTYYGKKFRLLVVKHHGELQFKVSDRIFSTLTAAARHVVGDDTRQISGPIFWGTKT